MFDETANQVGQHLIAVLGGAAELGGAFEMSHKRIPLLGDRFGFFFRRLEQFRIENRRADAIPAARPLSQIDKPAAVAAKREVFVGAHHDRLAGWATKAEILLVGHTSKDARY